MIHTCVSEGKKCSYFGKFGVLCFLVTTVLDSPFCIIADDLKIVLVKYSLFVIALSVVLIVHVVYDINHAPKGRLVT